LTPDRASPYDDGVAQAVNLPPALVPLRDLHLRLALDEPLALAIERHLATPIDPSGNGAATAWHRRALELCEDALSYVEREAERATQEMITATERQANAGRAAESLRRDVDSLLGACKRALDEEKARFSQRFAKQLQGTQDALEQTLRQLATSRRAEEFSVVFTLDPKFRTELERWSGAVFESWSSHTGQLLVDRARAAIEAPRGQLERVLGTPIAPEPVAPRLPPIPDAGDLAAMEEKAEMPTIGEAFKESLFGGLNAVAMIAGMVVVPVVGNFSASQPVQLRAVVMASCVLPIIGLAVWGTRRHRKKSLLRNIDKAITALKKNLELYFRGRVERFKVGHDVAVQDFLTRYHQSLADVVTRISDEILRTREARRIEEQTRMKVEIDAIQARQSRLRTARDQLHDQVRFELRRRLKELGA